jgi:uncharacterized protein (TIGR00369 family)
MPIDSELLRSLREINVQAAFNRWAEFEVLDAEPGKVTLAISWRDEFGQNSGFLGAGIIAALIDIACGFAAVTTARARVVAAHFSVNCLRPAVGGQFIARARVVNPGKSQITSRELFAQRDGVETLVATGEAILSAPIRA